MKKLQLIFIDIMKCIVISLSQVKQRECVSDNFIEINDNPGQNVVYFYVERIERRRELTTGVTEKENVRERAYEEEG
jgi:hypothetical protein